MSTRLNLQTELESIDGVKKVYFQPPESVKLIYPCIVYELSNEQFSHADNSLYSKRKRYSITIIDKNPDSSIPDGIEKFKYCSFNRFFVSDNLNHFVYTIYY